MKIEVWSDIVCPWCYIGKRRLETALEGLDEEVEIQKSGNTFDAHRLLHLAAQKGKQGALKERLLLAYMTEGVGRKSSMSSDQPR